MAFDVREVSRDKRIVLFGEMAINAGLPTEQVNRLKHSLAAGFPLTGHIQASGLFPEQQKPLACAIEDAWSSAKVMQHRAMSSCRSSGSKEVDEAVYAATLEEVECNIAAGPMCLQEVARRHGPLWLPRRRFGILQGDAVRAIDDFSEYSINSRVEVFEKLSMGGIDEAVVMAREYAT